MLWDCRHRGAARQSRARGQVAGNVIPVIEILAFCGATAAMQSNNYSAYIALGQQRVAALIMATYLIVMVPLMIVLGRKFGIVGVSYAVLIAKYG